jgi:SAM-dependent methyltransferase
VSYIKNSWISNADRRNNLEYQQWFDNCSSLDDCVKNGFIDFTQKIFTSDMYDVLGNPKNKTCLEIGSGGGRILNAACKFFGFAYGVDILNAECMKKTRSFILDNNNNSKNFELVHRDKVGKIKDKSVDFIYSFIVFQHFDSWKEVEYYFGLIKRVLTNDGICVIHFGRSEGKNLVVTKDRDFNDRECSLFVTREFAADYINKSFSVVETGEVTKAPWIKKRSGQFYVKFTR